VRAELDVFSRATARNGLIGVGVVLLCGFLAWQTNNARIFGWGVLASFSLNLEPHIVKRITESPALGYAIAAVIAAGRAFGLYEAWVSWRKGRAAAVATPVAEAVTPPTTATRAAAILATVEPVGASWYTRAVRAVRAWWGALWARLRMRFAKVRAAIRAE
jgi:hypothetical protein